MQTTIATRCKAVSAVRPSTRQYLPVSRLACRAATYKVTLQHPSGESQQFICDEGKTVLEAALAANMELPNLCHSGTCGSCAARVVSGSMEPLDSYLLDDAQQGMGYTLLCCTQPTSDMTLLTHQEAAMYTKPYNI